MISETRLQASRNNPGPEHTPEGGLGEHKIRAADERSEAIAAAVGTSLRRWRQAAF